VQRAIGFGQAFNGEDVPAARGVGQHGAGIMRDIVDKDGAEVSKSIQPVALKMYQEQRKAWVDGGGELISLPREEQAEMMRTLSSVGDDVSKPKPALHEAYQIVSDAAKRTRQAPSQ